MKVELSHLIAELQSKATALTAMANHLNDLKKNKVLTSSGKTGRVASAKEVKADEKIHDAGQYGAQYSLDDYGLSDYEKMFHLKAIKKG